MKDPIPTDPIERKAEFERLMLEIEQFALEDPENEGTLDHPDLTDPRDCQ